jgi:hypothetical protein
LHEFLALPSKDSAIVNVKRLIILALCCVPLSACGSAPPPHSDYFIVTYRPGTPDPTVEGRHALADAVMTAASGSPSEVLIGGAVDTAPASAAATALVRQRAAAVTQELTKAGIGAGIIHTRLREVGGNEFAPRKDTLTVQVVFGQPPGG